MNDIQHLWESRPPEEEIYLYIFIFQVQENLLSSTYEKVDSYNEQDSTPMKK